MHPAAAGSLLLIRVTVQVGIILPIIQIKHLFHVFLQAQHHYKSKGLTLGKHYAAPLLSDALEYALCPPGGKRAVAV